VRTFVYFNIGLVMGAGLLLWIVKGNARIHRPVEIITSPTPTSKPSATPTATAKPKATSIPTPSVSSQEINGFIDRFSSYYGVDPNKIRYTAICESGFNPAAVNGPYLGLFQFDARTWKIYRNRMGKDANSSLRAKAEAAIETAAYVYSVRETRIWPNCAAK
jgi:soluble lytic murein transglycosylase-like protein